MSQFIDVPGGRIAYEVTGDGPLVVLSHGMGDARTSYRFLAPLIAAAGYRVASVDLRGHGESSTGWGSYTRADTAGDLIAVIEALGGPAVIVGQSFSGGSATIAAANRPELVTAAVEIDPFTRPAAISLGALLSNSRYRKGGLLLTRVALTGSVGTWLKYLDFAYPGVKPGDWNEWLAGLERNLREHGSMKAAQKMGRSKPADAQAALPGVRCPVLVIMGTRDPDWPDPRAEAEAIVGLLPDGLGRYVMIEGAGHYPNAQYPEQVADAVIPFLKEQFGAEPAGA
ncbi:MAG TPA: alpha/beta hydrolase [Streptosporangiaceae bacterium]|nr:alpha/beta hydrolase [Streptosporangiaceae bacterium]